MHMPGFTAEHGLARTSGVHLGTRSREATSDPGDLTPAVFIQSGNTLFDCQPCMSGGPAGALVTYCCDPVATLPQTMSGGRVIYTFPS